MTEETAAKSPFNPLIKKAGIVVLILAAAGLIFLLFRTQIMSLLQKFPNTDTLKTSEKPILTGMTCPIAFACKSGVQTIYDGHPALGYKLFPNTPFYAMGEVVDYESVEKVFLGKPVISTKTSFLFKNACYQATYITPVTSVLEKLTAPFGRGTPMGMSSKDMVTTDGKPFNLIVLLQAKTTGSGSKSNPKTEQCNKQIANSGEYLTPDPKNFD